MDVSARMALRLLSSSVRGYASQAPLQTYRMCRTCAFINPSGVQQCTRCAAAFADRGQAVGSAAPTRPQPPPKISHDELRESFSWRCHSCGSTNHTGLACDHCAQPRLVQDPALTFLQRIQTKQTSDLWMCVNCTAVMPFDCGTCLRCRSTNDSFYMHNWRCRLCSKGHSSLNSAPCCSRFQRPRVAYDMPWQCACGHSNPIVGARCGICHRPRANLTVEARDWVCRCGVVQASFRENCSQCGSQSAHRKGTWGRAPPAVLSNWRCVECDSVNPKERILCRKCESVRKDACLERK
ncbi:translation elongation factor 1-beta [Perkinsela sp. CCAP 1560/4]|nr:hypothetical protein XU18_4672 [Perkinsela sp. CCAP 1560/4]KNH06449.1 translation elongation factor 1-beta [Perkinsela sp. CCAP 1560/4]|eukprot:KNH04002.1 hypothetical protein XU18_4672 [Perkinsela sp. CCAP 1560/4]